MVWIFVLSGALVLLSGSCFSVMASPQLPCEFYGTVAINGNPVPTGTSVSAYVNGVKQGSISVKQPGNYGGVGTFDERLIVLSGENDFAGGVPSITFKIGDQTADQTATYTPGMSSELDLSVGKGIGPLPNNSIPQSQVQMMATGGTPGTQILNSNGTSLPAVQPTLVPPPGVLGIQNSTQPATPIPQQTQGLLMQTNQTNSSTQTVMSNNSSPSAVATPLPVVAPPTVAAKFPLNITPVPANQTGNVPSSSTVPVVVPTIQVTQAPVNISGNNSTAGYTVNNTSVIVSFPSGRIINP